MKPVRTSVSLGGNQCIETGRYPILRQSEHQGICLFKEIVRRELSEQSLSTRIEAVDEDDV